MRRWNVADRQAFDVAANAEVDEKEARVRRDEIIRKVYYDPATGFGSIADTLTRARKVDKTIRREEVRDFLARQTLNQRKRIPRYNSYIPGFPRDQFQVDLADFGAGLEYRYGLFIIDSFTKRLAVIPLKRKTADMTAAGLEVGLKRLNHPNEIMSDEGSEFRGSFTDKLNHWGIQQRFTRTPARFVERSIRTIREGIEKRLEALMLGHEWWKVVAQVVAKYNDTERISTRESPNELAKNEYDDDLIEKTRNSIISKAKFNRRYPELKVGDTVRVFKKPGRLSDFKESFNSWTETTHRVAVILQQPQGAPLYRVDGRLRPLMRHELLKIEGAEEPPIPEARRRIVGKRPG